MCGSSNEASPDIAVTSNMEIPTSLRKSLAGPGGTSHNDACQKERANKWSDEEGKMAIGSDMFSAVLPSADEVGLQWRISELRVALRASESARLESEGETEALQKYLAEVEAAAAGLQSRVQELEHLIAFSSKDEMRELDQLRAKIAMEASKEAHAQTAKAATAVAAAREATMELDKVKRHSWSLIKAQEEEAERLRVEAAECRTLYHARDGQIQAMKEQIWRLEQNIKTPSNAAENAMRVSQEEVAELQKCLAAAKLAAHEKDNQYLELLEAFEFQKGVLHSADNCLKESERQKKELFSHNQWLEQQVVDLQKQEQVPTTIDYDQEMRKVRSAVEAEKQHLLAELATLRNGNQSLELELGEWQEKFHSLSQHVSANESFTSTHKTNMKGVENALQSTITSSADALESERGCSLSKKVSDEKKTCSDERLPATRTSTGVGTTMRGKVMKSQASGTLNLIKCKTRSISCTRQNDRQKHHLDSLDECCGVGGKEDRQTDCGLQEDNSSLGISCHKTGCDFLREKLLAAAHREIVKLKEVNRCLVAACQNQFRLAKAWHEDAIQENESVEGFDESR